MIAPKSKVCFIFLSGEFAENDVSPDLYAVPHSVKVIEEDPPESLFLTVATAQVEEK